jgi:hypothetical protein
MWRRMKVDAHPLMVAVALGFLGPAALAGEDDDESPLAFGISDSTTEYEPGPAPDADELQRVELEWNAAMAEWDSSKTRV